MSEKLYTCTKCGSSGRSAHTHTLIIDFTDEDWAFLRFNLSPPCFIMCATCFEGYRLTRFTDRIAGPTDKQKLANLLVFTLGYARNNSHNKALNDMLIRAVLHHGLEDD